MTPAEWFTRAALVLVGGACSAAGDGARMTTGDGASYDSGGVAITHSVMPESSYVVTETLSSEPVLRVGGSEPDSGAELTGVVRAVTFRDGSIAIADRGHSRSASPSGLVASRRGRPSLRYFGPRQADLRVVGARGDGPGEYRELSELYSCGSGVCAWDGSRNRLIRFDRSGAFVDARELPEGAPRAGPPAGVLEDGTLVLRVHVAKPEAYYRSGPVVVDSARVITVSPSGAMDTLFTIPEAAVISLQPGRRTIQPFGPTGSVVVHGSRVHVGWSERAEIRIHDARGRLEQIVR